MSLLEALRSPLFKAYQQRQPFNKNHLRPCPLLDNPDSLKEVVHASGARSTDMLKPEDVDVLTDKCQDTSRKWGHVADKIWYERPDVQKEMKKEGEVPPFYNGETDKRKVTEIPEIPKENPGKTEKIKKEEPIEIEIKG